MESEEGVWLRKDFCPDCWQKVKEEDPVWAQLYHWRAKCAKVVAEFSPENAFDLIDLIKSAQDEGSTYTPDELFIIALYLERKKLIAFQRQEEDNEGKLWLVYEINKSDETFSIPKVTLKSLDMRLIEEKMAPQLNAWERALKHKRAGEKSSSAEPGPT
ncbi:MAG: hypothetical protein K0S07_117 [Chlamydiales bacterium]|nr:hypothetical protein [Chlamydiales bacterium]